MLLPKVRQMAPPIIRRPTRSAYNLVNGSIGITTFEAAGASRTIFQNNTELQETIDFLHSRREEVSSGLDLTVANDKARNAGVYLAWLYEKADIKLGGSGSVKDGWTQDEKDSILDKVNDIDQNKSRSGVRGAEGHHINNVANHPDQAANPDNIDFARNRPEHKEMHGGDFKNPTEGPLINKDQMLRNTVKDKNIARDLQGLATAIKFAVGTGFVMGFAVTLAIEGISFRSLGKALIRGAVTSFRAGGFAIVNYGLSRTVGEALSRRAIGFILSHNVQLSTEGMNLIAQGISGLLTTAVFSTIRYVSLRYHKVPSIVAVKKVAGEAAYSIVGLTLSMICNALFGKKGRIIFSVAWSGLGVGLVVYKNFKQKKENEGMEFVYLEARLPIYAEGYVV